MAAITIIGIIDSIKYLSNNTGCFVFLSEFKKGYRKSDGTRVEDKYLSWKCIFKQGLVKYINTHFSNGMVVEVKGDAIPYAIAQDKIVDGYSVLGQTINMFSVPHTYHRQEQRMVKESLEHGTGTPDLESFQENDF